MRRPPRRLRQGLEVLAGERLVNRGVAERIVRITPLMRCQSFPSTFERGGVCHRAVLPTGILSRACAVGPSETMDEVVAMPFGDVLPYIDRTTASAA
jgi:hypothetical protein